MSPESSRDLSHYEARITLTMRPHIRFPWQRLVLITRAPTRAYATSSPKPTADAATNPVLAQFLKRKSATASSTDSSTTQLPARGDLAPSSIFSTVNALSKSGPAAVAATSPASQQKQTLEERNPTAMASFLDPAPSQRLRWERKMLIRAVHKRGRLSKTQHLARTERSLTSRSEYWKTSMKKLQPLANQIAGKSIEDAIVQMDFSKKKIAARVHDHLVEARNRAIVERGMGLGEAQGTAGEPVRIRLKDGAKYRVMDRTGIYVDQAWVGKGPYGKDRESRAYGRTNILWLPQTSTSFTPQEKWTCYDAIKRLT